MTCQQRTYQPGEAYLADVLDAAITVTTWPPTTVVEVASPDWDPNLLPYDGNEGLYWVQEVTRLHHTNQGLPSLIDYLTQGRALLFAPEPGEPVLAAHDAALAWAIHGNTTALWELGEQRVQVLFPALPPTPQPGRHTYRTPSQDLVTVTHDPAEPSTVVEVPDFMRPNGAPSSIRIHDPQHLHQAAAQLITD